MDVGLHQIPDCRIDLPVAGQRGHAAERLGDDMYAEMPQAARSTCMSRMKVALILDDEFLRREALRQ